ncbi:MAG TPA: DUF1552 domain-containing protein [Polyangiaceae bacterium]|nr:DUF1552 domain-containing protein [Polyangiaceae bacterium]
MNSSKYPLSRRTVLRGIGGAALAMPLLNDVFKGGVAQAASAPFPKRLFLYFTPNGTLPADFFGPGGSSLTLGNILAPLAPHKNDLLVLDNLDNVVSKNASGDPHGVGIGCLFTGQKLLTGAQAQGMSSGGWAAGISIDQYVAAQIGKTTKLGSVELIGKSIAGSIFSRISFAGSDQPIAPEPDPQNAFDRMFGSLTTPAGQQAQQLALRKSVLDNVLAELNTLSGRVSAADKLKIQAHAAALRDIETRLATTVTTGGSCMVPMRPATTATPPVAYDPYAAQNAGAEVINAANDTLFPSVIKSHFELVARAFACDITRVASLMAAPSRSDVVMSWLGLSTAHHEASHMSDTQGAPYLTKINNWYAQQLSDFITTLKSIPEGNGTVFDNTLIVWGNELGIGNIHSHTRVPFLLAGSAGGYFKTGRYVSFPSGTFHNNLLASVALAMGVPLTNNVFGNPMYCTGPLPGLTA